MINRTKKLLSALERRGFVVMHKHGSLQVVPSDRRTPALRPCSNRSCQIYPGRVARRTGEKLVSIYDVDWDEEFGRKKPAQPSHCTECAARESLVDCSECDAPLCKYCVDLHLENYD